MPDLPRPSQMNQYEATVLVVDNSRANRELLFFSLRRKGYKLILAATGAEAIELIRDNPQIDLILLDLELSGMDGFEFLKWRQVTSQAQTIPVIVNSSLDDMDTIVQALELDAYDYFTKPLSQQDLDHLLPLKIKNAITSKRLIQEITSRNALLNKEMFMAGSLQRSLLPPQDIRLPNISCSYLFRPCEGVGGDFYDFIEIPGHGVYMLMADVTGHGAAPAMVASMLKVLTKSYFQSYRSTAKALDALNSELLRLTPDDVFVTAFVCYFNPADRQVSWASAGHPPQLLLSHNEPVRQLSHPGLPLGIVEQEKGSYTSNHLTVRENDVLLLYTDGLVEAVNQSNEQYGLFRLKEIFTSLRGANSSSILQGIWDDIAEYTNHSFDDDLTASIIEFTRQ